MGNFNKKMNVILKIMKLMVHTDHKMVTKIQEPPQANYSKLQASLLGGSKEFVWIFTLKFGEEDSNLDESIW